MDPAVHAAPETQHVVEAKHRSPRTARHGGPDDHARHQRDRGCEDRRPLGACLRLREGHGGAGRLPAGAGEEQEGRTVFQNARSREYLCDRLATADRPEARDARAENACAARYDGAWKKTALNVKGRRGREKPSMASAVTGPPSQNAPLKDGVFIPPLMAFETLFDRS